jgi:hypothetical protein
MGGLILPPDYTEKSGLRKYFDCTGKSGPLGWLILPPDYALVCALYWQPQIVQKYCVQNIVLYCEGVKDMIWVYHKHTGGREGKMQRYTGDSPSVRDFLLHQELLLLDDSPR